MTQPSTAVPFSVRGPRVLRLRQVVERTGLSATTIWRLEKKGLFPQRRQISSGRIGWLECEIDSFLAERPTAGPRRDSEIP